MTPFRWVDRDGTEHLLEGPELIETEIEAIAAKIDEEVDILSFCGPRAAPSVRSEIRRLMMRLHELNADCERWNAHALKLAREQAASIVAEIRRISQEASAITTVVAIHNEHIEGLRAQAANFDPLAGPATKIQRRAMEQSKQEPKPPSDVSRTDAHAWLMNDPAFYRPMSDEGGWFEWIDNEGAVNWLGSPLQIEIEVADAIKQLNFLVSNLTDRSSLAELIESINEFNILSERIIVLNKDLERFSESQILEEEHQWDAFRQNWLQLRKNQN